MNREQHAAAVDALHAEALTRNRLAAMGGWLYENARTIHMPGLEQFARDLLTLLPQQVAAPGEVQRATETPIEQAARAAAEYRADGQMRTRQDGRLVATVGTVHRPTQETPAATAENGAES